jgi:serine/threonine protein phosphatase PrpC
MRTRPGSTVPLIAIASEAGDSVNKDRAHVADATDAHIAVVADGAGGGSGASAAANAVIEALLEVDPGRQTLHDPLVWARWLLTVDARVRERREAGLTTAVVAVISSGTVLGASVGDSGACLCRQGGLKDLTRGQNRRPLLGGPGAVPVPFGPVPFIGTLVIASDGLFDHAPIKKISAVANSAEALADVPPALIGLVRGRSGGLPDDVSVIAARPGPVG